MKEEMIDVEVNLGKKLADKLKRMTKTQLTNDLIVSILRNRVQDETIAKLDAELRAEKRRNNSSERNTQLKLDLAESYVAQAKAMIDAVMERWDEYDV